MKFFDNVKLETTCYSGIADTHMLFKCKKCGEFKPKAHIHSFTAPVTIGGAVQYHLAEFICNTCHDEQGWTWLSQMGLDTESMVKEGVVGKMEIRPMEVLPFCYGCMTPGSIACHMCHFESECESQQERPKKMITNEERNYIIKTLGEKYNRIVKKINKSIGSDKPMDEEEFFALSEELKYLRRVIMLINDTDSVYDVIPPVEGSGI